MKFRKPIGENKRKRKVEKRKTRKGVQEGQGAENENQEKNWGKGRNENWKEGKK